MAEEKAKITFSDPIAVFCVILGVIGDISILFGLALAIIPVIGWPPAFMAYLIHLMCAFIAAAFLFGGGYLHTIWSKLIVVIGVILPLPTITLAICLAIVLNNKLISFLATQAALAAVTGGVGNVAEVGVAVAGKAAAQQVARKAAVEVAEKAALQTAERTAATAVEEGAAARTEQKLGQRITEKAKRYTKDKAEGKLRSMAEEYSGQDGPHGEDDLAEAEAEWEKGIPTYEDINTDIETPEAADEPEAPAPNAQKSDSGTHPRTVDLRNNKEKTS